MLTPIELIKATVDGMAARGFGRVINITSSAVKAPIDVLGLSNGARSGLTGFVAGVARSKIASQGVTINNLLPGKFDTDRLATTMQAVATKTGKSSQEVRVAQQAQIPAGRFGTPEEFGAICAFLCSVHGALHHRPERAGRRWCVCGRVTETVKRVGGGAACAFCWPALVRPQPTLAALPMHAVLINVN